MFVTPGRLKMQKGGIRNVVLQKDVEKWVGIITNEEVMDMTREKRTPFRVNGLKFSCK